jgi:hypothetical protein
MYFKGRRLKAGCRFRASYRQITSIMQGDLSILVLPWRRTIHKKSRRTDPGSLIFDGHFSHTFFLDDCVEVDFARRRTVQARTGTEAFAERGWDEEVVRLALESLRVQIIA